MIFTSHYTNRLPVGEKPRKYGMPMVTSYPKLCIFFRMHGLLSTSPNMILNNAPDRTIVSELTVTTPHGTTCDMFVLIVITNK